MPEDKGDLGASVFCLNFAQAALNQTVLLSKRKT